MAVGSVLTLAVLIVQVVTILACSAVVVFFYILVRTKKIPEDISISKLFEGKAVIILKVLFLLSIILRISTLPLITENDEAIYMVMSKMVFEGKMPYNDFFTLHMPAYFLVTSFLFKHLGVGVIQAKAVPFIFSMGTVVLLYWMANRIYGRREAVMTLLVASISTGLISLTKNALMYSECIFFSTASACLFIEAQKKQKNLTFLLAGLSCGIATAYRLFGVYVILTMFLYLVFFRRDNLKYLIPIFCGFLLVVVPLVRCFGVNLIGDTVVYNAIGRPAVGLAERLRGVVVYSVYIYPLAMVFGSLGVYQILKTMKVSMTEKFLLAWLVVVFAGTLGMRNVFEHVYAMYFVMAVPPLAILAGSSIHVRDANVVVILIALALLSLFCNMIYLLGDVGFHLQALDAAEFIERSTQGDVKLGLTGNMPYAHAISFISGRGMFLDIADAQYLKVHPGAYESIADGLNRETTIFVVTKKKSNPDERLIKLVEERCRPYEEYSDYWLYLCGTSM